MAQERAAGEENQIQIDCHRTMSFLRQNMKDGNMNIENTALKREEKSSKPNKGRFGREEKERQREEKKWKEQLIGRGMRIRCPRPLVFSVLFGAFALNDGRTKKSERAVW